MSDLLCEEHWFSQYGLYEMDRVFFMQQNRTRVDEQEQQFPGFRQRIRLVALNALGTDDERTVRKALSVLAIVGQDSDLESIRTIGQARGGAISKDAGAAEYEITHRLQAT